MFKKKINKINCVKITCENKLFMSKKSCENQGIIKDTYEKLIM